MLTLQICVLIIVISLITWILTVSIKQDQTGGPTEMDVILARYGRIEFVMKKIRHMAFGFVAITAGLFISVAFLAGNLAAGNKKVSDLPNVFKSEAKNLSFILLFFSFTYAMRFISDFWIFPKLVSMLDPLTTCTLNNGLVV